MVHLFWMKIIIAFYSLFLNKFHPMILIMGLIVISLAMSYNMFMVYKLSLLMMIFLLFTLGGVVILFLFMSSVTLSEIYYHYKIGFFMLLLLCIPFMQFSHNISIDKSLMNLYHYFNMLLMSFCMSYLIIVLLLILEKLSFKKTPLRSF